MIIKTTETSVLLIQLLLLMTIKFSSMQLLQQLGLEQYQPSNPIPNSICLKWHQYWHQYVSLSLSGACHENVATYMSSRHAGLSIVRRLAVARPKLSGRRSSSPFSARFASVFQFFIASLWEDPECRPRELGSGLDHVGTAQMIKEGQALLTDSIWQEWLSHTWPNYVTGDKIRPMDMEDVSETPIIQCIYLLL